MSVKRYENNPIISPKDIIPSNPNYEVVGTFNPGVTRFNDEVILLVRVAERPIAKSDKVCTGALYDTETGNAITIEFNVDDVDISDSRLIKTPTKTYLTSISHLRVARSKDGVNFVVDDTPAFAANNIYEEYGLEDARITQIDDTYYITYSAGSSMGITELLASTKDFKTFTRHGVILHPDNKDVELFPEKINGKYYMLHRPSCSHFGMPDIWIAESDNLKYWGNHQYLAGTREGSWDNGRIGGSAIPYKTDEGWLVIYHGATKEDRYCLGAMLLDLNEPWKILKRCEKPFIEPETDYEINGFFGNVIFNNGVLIEDDIVKLYYGAADTYVCYAELPLSDVMDTLV